MDEEQYYEVIEKIEKEKRTIQNDRIYHLSCSLRTYWKDFKQRKYSAILKKIRDKIAGDIIKGKKYSCNNEVCNSTNLIDYKERKIAVYYVVLGGYDNIPEPYIEFKNVDYILFVDTPNEYRYLENKFVVKKIPDNVVNMGKVLANRYLKFHPKEFLKEYEYSIYMDGNVRIVSDIRSFIQKCNNKCGLAMHAHRERDCVYDEAEVCILLRRGNASKLKKQIEKYRQDGMPQHYGMCEATIIVADLRNANAVTMLNKWWQEFYASGSMRDQVAWPYVLWKNGLMLYDVGCLGKNVYENYKVELIKHHL